MYDYTMVNEEFFVVVLSHKLRGPKVLCLHLTETGKEVIARLKTDFNHRKTSGELPPNTDEREHIGEIIEKQLDTKIFCQILYVLSDDLKPR